MIALFLVLLFVVFGGHFVAVGIGVPTAADAAPTAVTVGGITFRPAQGWSIAQGFPGPQPGILLTRGAGSLLVATDPELTEAGAALESYIEEVLRPEAVELQVSGTTEEVALPGGVTAVRRAYIGTFRDNPAPLEGDVTALVLPGGPAAVFDGWAHQGSYHLFAADVYAMAETAEVA